MMDGAYLGLYSTVQYSLCEYGIYCTGKLPGNGYGTHCLSPVPFPFTVFRLHSSIHPSILSVNKTIRST